MTPRVRTSGVSGPCVVLLRGDPGDPGAPVTPGDLGALGRELSTTCRVLEPFPRPSSGEVPAAELDVADLLAVLDECAAGERPILVGHASGATLGLAFAAAHPERVRGLCVAGGGSLERGSRARLRDEGTLSAVSTPVLVFEDAEDSSPGQATPWREAPAREPFFAKLRAFIAAHAEPPPTHHAVLHGVAGQGPGLLYVPGIDGSGELLLETAGRLQEHFRLVRVRYECAGPAPAGGDRYDTLAASLLCRAREAGLERPLVVAESFGVAVALQLALQAPDFVRGLALVNGFATWDRPARLALSRLVLENTPAPLFRWSRAFFAPFTLFWPRRDPGAVAAFRRADLRALGPGYARRARMIAGVDLEPELGRVAAPVALFAADKDRIVRSVRHAERMRARLPRAELEVLPRAGHVVLPLEREPWVERLHALDARCAEQPPDPGLSAG